MWNRDRWSESDAFVLFAVVAQTLATMIPTFNKGIIVRCHHYCTISEERYETRTESSAIALVAVLDPVPALFSRRFFRPLGFHDV